jgi:hypothetical protein
MAHVNSMRTLLIPGLMPASKGPTNAKHFYFSPIMLQEAVTETRRSTKQHIKYEELI